jgi:cytochrome c oxidase subunit 2
MDTSFRLFPEAASTFADRVDGLFAFLTAIALFFTFLICALILAFGVRYRRLSPASRRNPPVSVWLELTWSVVPFVLSMAMFGWGAVLYSEMRQPPAGAVTIDVVAKQWMWKLQHPGGQAEINTLHLPVGQPVRLRMISEDVIHSYYVPAFRVKQDVLPGYYTQLWFQPTKPGEFHLFCAEYCGTEHSRMRGSVVVMQPAEFADWLAGEAGVSPDVAGEQLFERFRCGTCHVQDGTGNGPPLTGLFGSQVPLQGSRTAVADDQYLRNSILDPAAQLVAGYQPLMPTYRGQLNEAQVLQLIAYIKSLRAAARSETGPQ